MHLKFSFVHKERDPIERDFDIDQLGGRILEVGDHVILPDPNADDGSPAIVYEINEVMHVLPVGDYPYHIHVICVEIIEEEHDDDSWEHQLSPYGDN